MERYQGTLAREWTYVRDYASERERRSALSDFVNYYNHERPTPGSEDDRRSAGLPAATGLVHPR
ncbi:hypothetical protein GCM10010252_56510 [Streptomyces aureoverticillatus]|nr:hypothetical protein GCM10010252_56510 [Streptomyces aureoverticillatus]